MPLRDEFPPYSYVPGLWPHPWSDPDGHRYRGLESPRELPADWAGSEHFRLGIDLFDAGYYWEAHEVWEGMWHAAGRRGEVAGLLKALIQLAVCAVKVREGRLDGVRTHAVRAAELLSSLELRTCGGIDLESLIEWARQVAADPPQTPAEPRQPTEVVFSWRLRGDTGGTP
jgi:hypothetical protein